MAAVVTDIAQGLSHSLAETATLGRNTDSTICLPDARVSRRHAMIRKQDEGTWWFYDLGSYNGSYLNGRRVTTTRPLNDGDVIRIADFEFRFQLMRSGVLGGADGSSAAAVTQEPMIIFVSDIKGFTRLSELLPPEDTAQAIGTWYGEVERILTRYGASIDKFIGDAVLAYWTDISPESRGNALTAAKRLRQATYDIHDAMRATFEAWDTEFACGVAVHLGEVSYGTLGPGTLTMLGDAVNTAFRIQSLTRTLGIDILASDDLFSYWPGWLPGRAHGVNVGVHDLKGRQATVELWSVESCPGDYA
jgi:adenylate cyclase